MGEFFSALFNPSIPFIRYAFFGGLLSSIPFGIIGTWVTIKRISYLAGAIAHSVLAGIGMSLYFSTKYNLHWLHPLLGALFAAIAAALIIGFVSIYAKEREDTIIGAIWAIGMSLGLLFIAKTPGYINPMTYLFGNILIISQTDLILLIFLDIIIVVLGFLFYHQFQAIIFDEEFARIRGIKTNIFYILLLLMTAVTVVLMTTIIGIVMVIALLTLPAAIAGFFAKKIWVIMLIAVGLTALFTSFGLMISYMTDLPAGSTIILISGVVYLAAVLVKKIIL
ncbi:MAG: metal ABC transporter permease [Spirochaetales bacterium]|nr:metal ABC transporter permease [Spirochaetales bacterium]